MVSIVLSIKTDGDLLFKERRINADQNGTQIDADEVNEIVKSNRIRFFRKHSIDPVRVVTLAGTHGTHIETITEDRLGNGSLNPNTRIKGADGLVTNVPDSYLMITGADCFPLFFWDNEQKVIGAAHAGWRGILHGIVPAMVRILTERFDSRPIDISARVGPGIRSCHFEIKYDVAKLFKTQYDSYIREREGKIFVDLAGIIKQHLDENGILPTWIEENLDCTYCMTDTYFSYRRDKPAVVEANAFIIHLK